MPCNLQMKRVVESQSVVEHEPKFLRAHQTFVKVSNFLGLEPQHGDKEVSWFSFDPDDVHIERQHMCCYLTCTTGRTHQIIRDNLNETRTYGIVSFQDKESHQIILEPEGRSVPELYVQVELATLVPLANQCKKLFLVGDPAPHPATVISDVAKNHGHGTSLLESLMQAGYPVKMLKTQY
ncbi:hypothetical protein PIB30_007798 [Stylosanthes scabra]|uniref:MnmG N-terminal domain-containing protein n=1 Tax=Stylosanthes scabra TaxID=79078 RepID=A0ABU6Z1S3_9FABA|nr:hypothetical protein [Stylosanthes scabra]